MMPAVMLLIGNTEFNQGLRFGGGGGVYCDTFRVIANNRSFSGRLRAWPCKPCQ